MANSAPWIFSFEFEQPVNHGTEGGGLKLHAIEVTVDLFRIAQCLGKRAVLNTTGKATALHRAVQVRSLDAGAAVVVLQNPEVQP